MDARYLRISQDRLGLELGVDRQRKDCKKLSADAVEFLDNDISAAKGKPRPGYTALVAAIKAGQVKRVIVWQSSRIWRNRRERAAGIELFRERKVSLVCVRGQSFDLSTATGRSMAAVIGEFDTLESEIKGERVEAWAAQRAEMGLHHGGPRLYGYSPDGMTKVPEEAAQVRSWYKRLLAGDTVYALAKSAGCSAFTMRRRLRNPYYAALRIDTNGAEHQGKFPAVVPVQVWRDAQTLLASMAAPKPQARSLGGGLYVCERCNRTVCAGVGHRGEKVYRCWMATGGTAVGCGRRWRREWIDEYVDGLVRERLGRKDLRGLLAVPEPRADTEELHLEAAGIRARLSALATDSVLKGVDVTAAVAAAKTRLATIDQLTAPHGDVAAPVLSARNPVKAYDGIDENSTRQAVIRRLMTVTLTAPPRGRWPYRDDPDQQQVWYVDSCVEITPRRPS